MIRIVRHKGPGTPRRAWDAMNFIVRHFDDTQLRRLDITLLLVFEEAMAQGKLSAAARRLGLTQSAISHAIRRLRDVFNDELFIRTAHGVQPTPRALALRAPLAEALSLIAHAA